MSKLEKIFSNENVVDLQRELKGRGSKIVFTNGCFDLLHIGHVRLLQAARSFGDVLIVGLNSDDSVRKLKGSARPVVCQSERAEILAALACVDYVVVFDESTPIELIRQIRPNIHVKGAEYSPGCGKEMPELEVLGDLGVDICFVPMTNDRSSTRLIARITSSLDSPE